MCVTILVSMLSVMCECEWESEVAACGWRACSGKQSDARVCAATVRHYVRGIMAEEAGWGGELLREAALNPTSSRPSRRGDRRGPPSPPPYASPLLVDEKNGLQFQRGQKAREGRSEGRRLVGGRRWESETAVRHHRHHIQAKWRSGWMWRRANVWTGRFGAAQGLSFRLLPVHPAPDRGRAAAEELPDPTEDEGAERFVCPFTGISIS